LIGIRVVDENPVNHGMRLLSVGMVKRVEFTSAAQESQGEKFQPAGQARQKSYVVGEHVWNMCDFKTCQGIGRVGALNHKGVFTRDRRPKLAAHRLREIWGAK
jgi:beta-galactosidase/beta-glucuronidase